jgi:hypothetical protein
VCEQGTSFFDDSGRGEWSVCPSSVHVSSPLTRCCWGAPAFRSCPSTAQLHHHHSHVAGIAHACRSLPSHGHFHTTNTLSTCRSLPTHGAATTSRTCSGMMITRAMLRTSMATGPCPAAACLRCLLSTPLPRACVRHVLVDAGVS